MYFFTDYTYQILNRYRTHVVLDDTIPIGFTGVASQRVAPVFSNENSEDTLYFAAGVDFTTSQALEALVRIRSVSPQYEWMANDDPNPQDTPVGMIAGVIGTAMPLIQLVQPFFIAKQGRLQMQFTNAVATPITGGNWTWKALRLTNPYTINGVTGWNYSLGFGS
jgi:hypothetical protein